MSATATVRHNMGTVQEHIGLCCAVDWACGMAKEQGRLQYVDTHAMAPFNRPVGNDFNLLGELAATVSERGIPTQARGGARSYFDSLRRSVSAIRPRAEAWYPTHFLHAWAAARARGVACDALLFENDGEGEGRRISLARFLPAASYLVRESGDEFMARLADPPGDFRLEASWPAPASRSGCALVLMNDPLQVQPEGGGGSYMNLRDFRLIHSRLDERYVNRPALSVNVVFCFSNPGLADRYRLLTEALAGCWADWVEGAGEYACTGIKWGSFMVFVAASNTGNPWVAPTFDEAFDVLKRDIKAGLSLAHHSPVEFFQTHGPDKH